MSTPPTAILSEEQILQLRNNNVTELDINLFDKGLNDTSIDWTELGQLIDVSNNLKKLVIDEGLGTNWTYPERSRQLFTNIAASTSIENLVLMNLGSVAVKSIPLCLETMANKPWPMNLRSLEFWDCQLGSNEYDALANFLKNTDCNVENLVFSGGEFNMRARETVRDALEINTSVKKLHIKKDDVHLAAGESLTTPPISWTCRNSAIEELTLIDIGMDDIELTEMGSVLKDNNTLKKLKLYFGLSITTGGWEALTASLRNNNTLVELDLSDNNLNDEGIASLVGVLANNSTLKTLRLENLDNVTRVGWRKIPNVYMETPTCVLQNLYLGGNTFEGFTFYHFVKACCYRNRTLKKLCLTLPSNRELNTHRVGWNQWMNLLLKGINKQESIIRSYNSNHVLETICYPEEEARLITAMSTCTTIAKNLPSALQMNREPDKFSVARRKILQNHYFDQEVITKNREQSDYKTLLETIVEASINLEKTEQLPNMMAWVGRDIDGISLMYELMQRIPLLCENVGKVKAVRSSKRKRND